MKTTQTLTDGRANNLSTRISGYISTIQSTLELKPTGKLCMCAACVSITVFIISVAVHAVPGIIAGGLSALIATSLSPDLA